MTDVRVCHACRGMLLSKRVRVTSRWVATPAGATFAVVRVEPVHEAGGVIPQREYKHHTAFKCFAHDSEPAQSSEFVFVFPDALLISAEFLRDGVAFDASNCGLLHRDDLSILSVELANLNKVASVGVVFGEELRGNCEWLRGVDCEGRPRPVEILVP